MTLYLDTSVIVPLFVTEAHSELTQKFFAKYESEVKAVSDFAMGEIGAALSRLVRMNYLAIDHANNQLSLFDHWVAAKTIALATETIDIRRAAALVRRFELKLLLPDAVHLASCERHGFTLVTFDDRLAKTAQMIGLPVLFSA